jgi:hypothetical protein
MTPNSPDKPRGRALALSESATKPSERPSTNTAIRRMTILWGFGGSDRDRVLLESYNGGRTCRFPHAATRISGS